MRPTLGSADAGVQRQGAYAHLRSGLQFLMRACSIWAGSSATKDPLRYEFANFGFVSRQIARGSRLRLLFGLIHSIFSEKNSNSGGFVREECIADARTVTVTLFHAAQQLSALYVPYAALEQDPTEAG